MATAARAVVAFPDVDATGGKLLRVLGPPEYPRECAEYSVVADPRPCPFCGQAIGDKRGLAIMADGEWRWADIDCAVFAKKGKSDMVPGAPWRQRERPNCVKCGGRWGTVDGGGEHCHAHGGVWCDDECTIAYEGPVNA